METPQQPALVQIDDWHIPDFTHDAEEELETEVPAQVILDSAPSTIPFDEDSPPRQLSEQLSPGEEVEEGAGSSSLVIEISDDEEGNHTRPRRRNTRRRRDYTYQEYQDTIENAISGPTLHKRKREDSDVGGFRSKMNQFVKGITELYEALKNENKRLEKETHQWKKDKKLLELQTQYLQRQINDQKRRNILKCALCDRTFNQSWKVLGCGHTLCEKCVEDIKSKGSLFEYPCPYAQCQKPIRSCLDFYPNVVEA